MSAVGSALLDLLGLSKTVDKMKNVVVASKQGVDAINAAKELLDTPDGQKFKKRIIEILGGSVETPDGKVHIDVDKKEPPHPRYAKGHYEWDGFKGWVWTPEE